MKITKLLIIPALSLMLVSCGNGNDAGNQHERQENPSQSMDRENGMMDNNMMDNGPMMQDDMMGDGMMDRSMMSDEMRQAMMSEGMGPGMMEDMRPIRTMLMNHEQIDRRVEDLENGVKSWTTSPDPQIASAIQTHVRQMKERMEEQRPIRQMDPLFRELFKHADKIDMKIEDLENGVVVTETSEDPQAVKLIRQHAHRAVSEFAGQGMQRAMQPTPLPEGYQE